VRTLGVIPARGGSKQIPRKNIKLLNGKPLIQYTIEAAQNSRLDRFIVSTEDEEIKAISESLGAEVMDRPVNLATDAASTADVLMDVVTKIATKPDVVVLLQPTSPLRDGTHINEALDVFEAGEFDSVMSVGTFTSFIWVMGLQCPYPVNYDAFRDRPRRQDVLTQFIENGAIYIFKTKGFLEIQCVLSGKLGFYVMPEETCLEIDTPFQFWMCEQVMKGYGRDNS
jgi:CMP-N,N'-diacetyllegionaminic acid synthase